MNQPTTQYKDTVLVYNPRAGKFGRKGASLVKQAVDILSSCGHHVTVAPTTGPQAAGALAREHIERGADLIVAAGGDGTINEVAEGMVHSKVPLAILPAGTANVLAMELKLGDDLERVASNIDQFEPRRISVGHLTCDGGRTSRHFLLMAGIGLDARIVYNLSAPLKNVLGKGAYWVASWSLLGRSLDEFEVKIEGEVRRCSFALVSKVRNYGGDLEIARDTSLLDDRFEVVLFEGRSSLRYVKYFAGVAFNRLNGMKGVTVLRARKVCLSPVADARVYMQIDGEYAGRLPGSVEIVEDALTVLIPPKYKERVGKSVR